MEWFLYDRDLRHERVKPSLRQCYTAQKMKFSIKDFFSKCDQTATADLVTITEEIPN